METVVEKRMTKRTGHRRETERNRGRERGGADEKQRLTWKRMSCGSRSPLVISAPSLSDMHKSPSAARASRRERHSIISAEPHNGRHADEVSKLVTRSRAPQIPGLGKTGRFEDQGDLLRGKNVSLLFFFSSQRQGKRSSASPLILCSSEL